ncbi:ankyrin repeat domain-containing protein [Orrella marina]|nr:ankyrin repeat domain-containing protein [Orrella marina]
MFFILISGWHFSAQSQNREDFWIYVQNDRDGYVKSLLDQGVDPNTRTEIGNPLLMQAVRDNAWAVFDLVLDYPGADINIMNGYQETPLMYVSIVGDLDRVKRLIAKGAQVNHLGWTPLHYAASKGHTDVVKYLLQQGAMPNAPAPDGTSPIMMAARTGSVDAVQALLDAGADPAAININGDNAVSTARDHGHSELADALTKVIAQRSQR